MRQQTSKKQHVARMNAIHAANQQIVASGICPDCGTSLRRNLALTGWWQCDAVGRPDYRRPENRDKADCSFQCFTE